MPLATRAWPLLLLAVLPLLAAGCGGKSDPKMQQQETELKDIHEIYYHYLRSQQKPPGQLSHLTAKEYEGIYPAAVGALQKGKYLIVWGVTGKEAGSLLAYEKDAPTQGGTVLMADGTVKTLSAEEFKAAKGP